MSTRIDNRRSAETRSEQSSERTAKAETKTAAKAAAKQPAPKLEHSAGSRALAAGQQKSALSGYGLGLEFVPEQKRAGSALPPAPDGSIPWVKVTPYKAFIKPPPAPPPPAPKPKLMPAPLTPLREYMKFQAAAEKKYDALVAEFKATKRSLEQGAKMWDQIAAARRKAEAGGAMAAADDTAAFAERQAQSCRELLPELRKEFGAAKHEFEQVLGMTKQVGIGKPPGVDPNVDPPPKGPDGKPILKGYQSELERLNERFDRFNRSIEGIKSSGVLAPLVFTAYVAAAELNGRTLTTEDYKRLDGINQGGAIFNVPLGIVTGVRSVTPGAPSNAPGVDYRSQVQRNDDHNGWQARQPQNSGRVR